MRVSTSYRGVWRSRSRPPRIRRAQRRMMPPLLTGAPTTQWRLVRRVTGGAARGVGRRPVDDAAHGAARADRDCDFARPDRIDAEGWRAPRRSRRRRTAFLLRGRAAPRARPADLADDASSAPASSSRRTLATVSASSSQSSRSRFQEAGSRSDRVVENHAPKSRKHTSSLMPTKRAAAAASAGSSACSQSSRTRRSVRRRFRMRAAAATSRGEQSFVARPPPASGRQGDRRGRMRIGRARLLNRFSATVATLRDARAGTPPIATPPRRAAPRRCCRCR